MKDKMDTSFPKELRPSIYQLPAEKPGSHVYLIKGEAKNVLIDTGITAKFAQLASQLQKLGLGVKDIHFVILTHEHFDHIGATTFSIRRLLRPMPWPQTRSNFKMSL